MLATGHLVILRFDHKTKKTASRQNDVSVAWIHEGFSSPIVRVGIMSKNGGHRSCKSNELD